MGMRLNPRIRSNAKQDCVKTGFRGISLENHGFNLPHKRSADAGACVSRPREFIGTDSDLRRFTAFIDSCHGSSPDSDTFQLSGTASVNCSRRIPFPLREGGWSLTFLQVSLNRFGFLEMMIAHVYEALFTLFKKHIVET